MNCSKCFVEITEGAKFCKNCGNAIEQNSEPAVATPPAPEYQPPPPEYQPSPDPYQTSAEGQQPVPEYPPHGQQPPYGYPSQEFQPPPQECPPWEHQQQAYGQPPYGYQQAPYGYHPQGVQPPSYGYHPQGVQPPPYGYPPHGYQPPPYGYYQSPAKPPRIHYAPGSYAELAHKSGGSILFLIGICLFSAGHFFNAFAGLLAMNWLRFLGLFLLALPITAFWLIFASSKIPKLPEKTLPALTCFKIYVIINFVLQCFLGLMLLIAGVLAFLEGAASRFNTTTYYLIGIGFFIFAVISLVAHILCYRFTLSVLASLRQSFFSNVIVPIKGIVPFTILTYISVGLAIFSSITWPVILHQLSRFIINFVPDFALTFIHVPSLPAAILSTFFVLLFSGGVVVCVVALNMFNSRVLARCNYRQQQ